MVLVLSLHAVSFFVYMVAIVVTLLSVGGPHWYRTHEFYGGLWKRCDELKLGHPEVCRRLTSNDTSGGTNGNSTNSTMTSNFNRS